MKHLFFTCVLFLSIPLMAYAQRSAWTTEEGDLTAMILDDEKKDSIVWLNVHGVLGVEDIATIRSLPLLKKLNIRGCKINELPDSAFYGMPNLEVIKLPKKVKVIGAVILKDCPNLKKVYIPKKPTSISPYAYEGVDPNILKR